jgi:hypothetical protein
VIEDFEGDLFGLETDYPNLRKFVATAREFGVYSPRMQLASSITARAIDPASEFPRLS